MIRFLVIAITLWFSTSVHAAPVLLFSDLTSGPKTGLGDGLGSGAVVTVWGTGLGATQGASTIQIGSVEVTQVYEWTNATVHSGHPSDLYTYHKMQTISFSIPATALNGANTISVTVGGVDSGSLPFTVRAGTIYWVATSANGGDDANAGTYAAPWEHPGYFLGSYGTAPGVVLGDICYITDGVSVEDADNSGAGVTNERLGGTEALPFFILAYPQADVVFQGTSSAFNPGYQTGKTGNYVHISKILLKAPSTAYVYIEHGRTIACGITDHPTSPCTTQQSGLINSSGAPGTTDGPNSGINGNQFLGNYIYDYCADLTGDKQQHTMYVSNRHARANAAGFNIGWNHFDNNWGNGGINVYDEWTCTDWDTSSIHDNAMVDQRGWGIGVGIHCSVGSGPSTTEFNVYNNLILRAGRGPAFVSNTTTQVALAMGSKTNVGDQTLQTYTVNAFNNTIYGTGEPTRDMTGGNPLVQGAVSVGASTYPTLNYKNNIVYDTEDLPFTVDATDPTTHTNNLWHDPDGALTVPTWDTSPIITDPQFVTNGSDFSLQSTSPALNAGTELNAVFTTDILGVTRGIAGEWSIGAYDDAGTAQATATVWGFRSGTTIYRPAAE